MPENLLVYRFFRYCSLLFFNLLTGVLLFGRSFTGILIFNFRLGEIIIGVLFCILIFLVFKHHKNIIWKEVNLTFLPLFFLIIFFVISILFDISEISIYIFKASSFIWVTTIFFISFFLIKFIPHKSWIFIIYLTIPLIIYYLNLFYFPLFLKDFFSKYSDKFDYLKGSDLVASLIFCINVAIFKLKSKKLFLFYSLFLISLYFPFVLFKSKGAFLGLFLYLILFLFNFKKYFKLKISLVLLSVFIVNIYISSWLVSNTQNITSDTEEFNIGGKLNNNVTAVINQKDTISIFDSIYLQNKRIYSLDNNANWRLQIWQDVVFDLLEKNKFIFGYGFYNIIPAMDVPERQGQDGTNENVHNFLINILARGGLILAVLYMLFLYKIFEIFYKNKLAISYLLLILIPLLAVSFFDSSMESVRFPIIFYSSISISIYFLINNSTKNNYN